MKASGNGAPDVCANNLLRMVRGEVPYERVKGIAPRVIDSPVRISAEDFEADAQWLVETYEPRVVLEGLDVKPDGTGGDFNVTARVTRKEA